MKAFYSTIFDLINHNLLPRHRNIIKDYLKKSKKGIVKTKEVVVFLTNDTSKITLMTIIDGILNCDEERFIYIFFKIDDLYIFFQYSEEYPEYNYGNMRDTTFKIKRSVRKKTGEN